MLPRNTKEVDGQEPSYWHNIPEIRSWINNCRDDALTYWGWGKMATILQTTFSNIFLNEKVRFFIQISLKFVHKGPFNNKTALVQIMNLQWSSDKSLSEPMMGYLTDAYMCHSASMSQNVLYNSYCYNHKRSLITVNTVFVGFAPSWTRLWPQHSVMGLFATAHSSVAVAVAASGLGATKLFQNDFHV